MLAYICLYIIAYSHIKSIFRPDLRIDFSSDLYISIIFMFACCLKSFVLVYCNCFYYACIHIIVSLLLHVYNYIHARFRSFKAYLRVAFRQCLYTFIIFCVKSFVLVFCICFNQCLLLSRSSCSFWLPPRSPRTPLALLACSRSSHTPLTLLACSRSSHTPLALLD